MELDCDEILKALANPLRREILSWLREPQQHFAAQSHPLELGVCCGLINERCGLSPSTVSAHLAVLQKAGLITSHKLGQWVFYKRNEPLISAFTARLSAQL